MCSKPCDHCSTVKRCQLVKADDGTLLYLCGRCQRDLGYAKESRS